LGKNELKGLGVVGEEATLKYVPRHLTVVAKIRPGAELMVVAPVVPPTGTTGVIPIKSLFKNT
jgi:hypothetical protein